MADPGFVITSSGPGAISHPQVSISVVSHGDRVALMALLESIAAHERIDHVQLLVTDNLGSDLPDLSLPGWHSVVILRRHRPSGFAANHNQAFDEATGRLFCVLNPDVLFTQGVLDTLAQHLDQGRAHLAAPVLVDSRGRLQDSFRDLPTPWRIMGRRLGLQGAMPSFGSAPLLHPDWIAGMFMLLSSETFSRLGGFDDRYRLYFEDVDLCTRLRIAGMQIVVDPAVRLLHEPRRSSRRPGLHFLWHVRSAVRFFLSGPYRRARGLKRLG